MTPIKCPPPKIVAVKRSLRGASRLKQNIMDDDDLSVKDDFVNDDDSFDAKDLIEFERDEPLIDLSDSLDVTPVVQKSSSQDTVSSMNARNSNTLLTLLDMLEIGSVTRASEMARLGSCAKDAVLDTNPSDTKESSSSSSRSIPVESPGACAASSGKTDELSAVFPPLSIQPENPSIVKSCSRRSKNLNSDRKRTLRVSASVEVEGRAVREGIDEKSIDSTLRNSHQCQSEKSNEKFLSTSISFDSSQSRDSGKDGIDTKNSSDSETRDETLDKEKICHYNHRQQSQQQQNDLKSTKADQSDTNNNHESVCNQNSPDDSLSPTLVNYEIRSKGNDEDDESNGSLKFLSPHTSQRKLPPKFYSSTNSLNRDCFEASSRLKRLEERFKGFSYTKKLLRSSKVFSKSEEILSSYGKDLNSSFQLPLSSTTLSENCLRQLTGEDEVEARADYPRKASSSDEISGEFEIEIKHSNRRALPSAKAVIDRHRNHRRDGTKLSPVSDDSLLTNFHLSRELLLKCRSINLNNYPMDPFVCFLFPSLNIIAQLSSSPSRSFEVISEGRSENEHFAGFVVFL